MLAILASLAVALTVTPALALLLLPKHLDARESRLVGGLKARYRRMLPAFVDRPKTALGSLAVLLLLTAVTVPFLGEEFLPSFREYDFLMHWVEKPGTSIDAMRRITVARQPRTDGRARREELRLPHRSRRSRRRSRRSELHGAVDQPRSVGGLRSDRSKIQSIVDGYPGLYRDLLTYLRERIKEVLTGASATIVVRVYGPELDQLQAAGSGSAGGDRGR